MTRILKIVALVGAAFIAVGAVFALTGFIAGGAQTAKYYLQGSRGEVQTTSSTALLEAFQSIDIEGNMLDVEMRPSPEGYGITFLVSNGLPMPEARVEDGILKVTSDYPERNRIFMNKRHYDAIISYPSGTLFERVSVELSIGELQIENLQTKEFLVDLNVGDLNLIETQAQRAEISLSIGDFEGEYFDTKNLNMDLNIGDVNLRGTLEGETQIDLNTGDVDLVPTLPRTSYQIFKKAAFENKRYGEQGENIVHVDVNIGEVDVSFEE